MTCCSPNCKKWSTLTVALFCLFIGLLTAIAWSRIFNKILKYELSLQDTKTEGFTMWKETPIPMYLEFYLFNWTNADKYPQEKPNFTECGPYTYHEHHIRTNISFNDNNNTITYNTKRVWKFLPEKTKGSLQDVITTLNPIAVTVANIVKNRHIIVRRGVNFFFEEKRVKLYVTKTVDEFIFEGYDDPLLDLAQKINISGLDVPFKKFGWFVERNNSIDYDGVFNMNSGAHGDISQMGIIRTWNYKDRVPYYEGDCGLVQGTSGEFWYPPEDQNEVYIFATDICSAVKLQWNGTSTIYGVEGHQYVGREDVFDNGTLYPEMKCFTTEGETLYSGVRNVSQCKFGAPAFLSYPHFFKADPTYREPIIGMNPDPKKHTMRLVLEPSTGFPLLVNAEFQVNLLLEHIEGINIFSNVKKTYVPIFWFRQSAQMTKSMTNMAKLLLVAPKVGTYSGYGVFSLGALLLGVFFYVTFRRSWKSTDEESNLLNENSL